MNNPKTRQQWILDLLKSEPTLSYGDCFSKYVVKFSKSEQTFVKDWKKAQEQHKEYQIKVNKAKEVVSIKEEVKTLKKGLKTKQDRLLNLQHQVIKIQQELIDNEVDDYFINRNDNIVQKFKRPMNQVELNATRKNLKDLQGEISKIEGDYAPKENINTLKLGTEFEADYQ